MDNESTRRVLERSFWSIALGVLGNAALATVVIALVEIPVKRKLPDWGNSLFVFVASLVLYSILAFLGGLMGAGRHRRTSWNQCDDRPAR